MTRRNSKKIEEQEINPNGELLIPHNVTPTYGEPSIEYEITDSCELYLKNPTIVDYFKNHGALPKWQSLDEDRQLKPEQRIFARRFFTTLGDRYLPMPGWLQVRTFTEKGDKIEGMAETGHDVEIGLGGYVPDQFARPVGYQINFKGDLFPSVPSVFDIKQSIYGNCFLLATTNALLSHDSGIGRRFVTSIMRKGPDFSIVKLFNPKEDKFQYISVGNWYHCRAGYEFDEKKGSVQHLAPWPHILEKAYSGLGLKETSDRTIEEYFPGYRTAFGDGGSPGFSMRVLTGLKKENVHEVSLAEESPELYFPWGNQCIQHINIFFEQNPTAGDADIKQELVNLKKTPYSLLSELSVDQLREYRIFLKKLEANKETFIDFIMCSRVPGGLLTYAGVQEMLEKLHTSHGLPDRIYEAFLAIIQSCHYVDPDSGAICTLFSGKSIISEMLHHSQRDLEGQLFDDKMPAPMQRDHYRCLSALGHYSSHQLHIFNELKANLSQGNIYTVSTYPDFAQYQVNVPKNKKDTFDPKQQPKPPGIYPQHAYTICGVSEREIDGRKVLFIDVANPWGQTGLAYDFESFGDMAKQCQDGQFSVELKDFIVFFKDLSYFNINLLKPTLRSEMRHDFVQSVKKNATEIVGLAICEIISQLSKELVANDKQQATFTLLYKLLNKQWPSFEWAKQCLETICAGLVTSGFTKSAQLACMKLLDSVESMSSVTGAIEQWIELLGNELRAKISDKKSIVQGLDDLYKQLDSKPAESVVPVLMSACHMLSACGFSSQAQGRALRLVDALQLTLKDPLLASQEYEILLQLFDKERQREQAVTLPAMVNADVLPADDKGKGEMPGSSASSLHHVGSEKAVDIDPRSQSSLIKNSMFKVHSEVELNLEKQNSGKMNDVTTQINPSL